METVVVTGMMIDEEDRESIPNATLRVRADFVLYELSYVNSTLDLRERKDEMERMYKAILRQLPKHEGLKLRVGHASASADVETAIFDEIYNSHSHQGRLSFVVRANVKPDETYEQVRARVEKFVESSGEVGRSQSILQDEQYLGVDDLKSYRPALIKAIWDDIHASSNPTGATQVDIKGLERRTQYHPIGPLELELFIPYKIEYASAIER